MLRASKVLLCALSARVGFAVRQSIEISRSGSLANVMEKIGALIQTHDHDGAHSLAFDNLRMLAAITPGQATALNTALTDVIAEIEENVDAKIRHGFTATQAAVTSAINNLKEATGSAVTKKAHADQADQIWFNCIGVEKSKREDYVAAAASEIAALEGIVQPCKNQEDNNKISLQSPHLDVFTCDFSAGGSCNNDLDAYTAKVDTQVEDLVSAAQEARQVWTNFKNECDSAKGHAVDMQHARERADAAWQNQRVTCQTNHEARLLGLCSFGTALQSKCEKVHAYSHLIEGVDAVNGGPNSEPDRQAEWKTTQVTKCMLQKVIDGNDLDGQSLDSCEATVKYLESVGQFDRRQSEFATQTSETRFTCQETKITFKGETWTDYNYNIVTPYSPAVNLAVGTPPFAFCTAEASQRRGAAFEVLAGGASCPLGSHVEEQECEAAARALGKSWLGPKSHASFKTGCVLGNGGWNNKVTYNTGSGTRGDYVCKKAEADVSEHVVACEHTGRPECTLGKTGLCHGRVRYGKSSQWTAWREMDGEFNCSNREFGDPYHGKQKECVCDKMEMEQQLPSCFDQSLLAECLAWGRWSKMDIGCTAYAQGKAEGTYKCHACGPPPHKGATPGTLSRSYAPCSMTECLAMCDELYPVDKAAARQCHQGCKHYAKSALKAP